MKYVEAPKYFDPFDRDHEVTFVDALRFEIRKEHCPKCGSDVLYTKSWNGYSQEFEGYTLGQCTNPDCRIVTHTGNKLCMMNVCEWHEICSRCGKEICGDYSDDDGKPVHFDCSETIPKEYDFF